MAWHLMPQLDKRTKKIGGVATVSKRLQLYIADWDKDAIQRLINQRNWRQMADA
jgi:hypothetical protein